MMEMVKAEITSSETETSAGEEPNKSIELVDGRMASDFINATSKRKLRSWNSRRFWRSNNSNSSTQGSGSDQDIQDHFPMTENVTLNESGSRTNISKGHRHLRLPSRSTSTSGRQASSTESLLSIIRNFSTNHRTPSTPSSPQISDYELSSSFPTPLSTPGSPAGSFEVIPTPSNHTDASSIQVAVIDPSIMTHRSNRLSTTNFSTPYITLEIPTINYGKFLSPIHEVPTPLPSPAHTPIPSMRKADRCGSSDSSLSSGSSMLLGRKRSMLQQQRWNCNDSEDDQRCGLSAPSIIVEDVASNPENFERQSISIVVPSTIQILVESDSTQPSPVSSATNSPLPSPAKVKPPPLNILNSNFTRFETVESSTETNKYKSIPPLAVPNLCVSEPSPETTNLANLKTRCRLTQADRKSQCSISKLEWENVSLGSPPLRKHLFGDSTVNVADNLINDTNVNIRRVFKDTLDKSSSLELPHPPPIITITTNFSEVESDSDAGMLGRGGINNQKMCYLSPFVCYGTSRSDIANSESNLSSSGYSSMASPGVSPACSSKTLCIWMEEENSATFNRTQMRRKDRRIFHRAVLSPSLESSSPPLDSPPDNPSSNLSDLHHSNSSRLNYFPDSVTNDQLKDLLTKSVDGHKSTTADESHDEGIDVFHVGSNVVDRLDYRGIDSKLSSLARVHKSTSLDSKLMGQRRHNLKGDSLDTKLPSLHPGGTSSFHLKSLQLPELLSSWTCVGNGGNSDEIKMKVSPVSSRSESPLSDVKSAGLGRFSTKFYGMSRNDIPYTDSDGLYDYPSSETILPPTSIHRRHMRHKCDRRRERKTSFKSNRIDYHRELLDKDGGAIKRSFLDPCDRGVGRLVSAKRKSRVRAQSNIDFCASSSSNESLSTLSKQPRHKKSPQIINLRRGSSPICDVILTIQAASSLDELQSEVGEEKQEYGAVSDGASLEFRAFKLPLRTRHNTAFRFPEKRRQDSISKRREMPSLLRNSRGLKRTCLTPEGGINLKELSSTDSSYSESDRCDSNESLANLGEIEDSIDSPLV